MSGPVLDNIMKHVSSFPSMPAAAVKLLQLLDDEDVSTQEIERVLRSEPGLTANILKMANSAYFGLRQQVSSIKQAVVVLGVQKLKKLILSSCMAAVMEKPVVGYDLDPGALWDHSIAVTVGAEKLAELLQVQDRDTLFTGALLHDVGKLVMGEFVSEDIPAIEAAAKEGLPFQQAEREVLGTDHAEVGAHILDAWGFPDDLVSAVRWHHEPDEAPQTSEVIDLVHVANVLTLMVGMGVGREGLHYQPSSAATQRLGLRSGHLEAVASQTLQYISELTDLFTAL